MNKLKLWDKEYGLLDRNGKPVVSSRWVAAKFEKEHKNVLRDVQKITAPNTGVSENFARLNFEPSYYVNEQNKKQPEYLITRDGFVMLAMGFTGKKALQFKEAYIRRFNDMEKYIIELNTARLEFPELTQAILEAHETPMPYHFSNEFDMINRIVLGMSAKQYKEAHRLGAVPSIRPYLTAGELWCIARLQKTDIGLVLTEPDYNKRKRVLEWYFGRLKLKEISA
jgi:Rha family phage regulatory protein